MKRNNYIYLGLLAGLVYSIFAWGVDAYLLQQYHVAVPWLKFAVAVLPVMMFFLVVVLISSTLNNLILRALLWMAAATALSFIVSKFTFQGNEYLLKRIFPSISAYFSYVVPIGISRRLFVIIVMSNILFILGGLLMETVSEAMVSSQGVVGWLVPVILCLAFFAGAGYTADSNFNTDLREHLIELDTQLAEVSQLDPENLSERETRLIRRYTKLNVDLKKPRKLVIGNFDEFFSQSIVMIHVDDTWVTCSALSGRVGTCNTLED
jgi:hypothetical protein